MEQNRTEIQESINTELKNNVYKYITPYRLRLVLGKIKESFFNIVDDTAEKIKFSSPQFVSTNVKTALEEALSGGLTTGFGTLDFEYLEPWDGVSVGSFPLGTYKKLKIKGGKPNEKLSILFHTDFPNNPIGGSGYQTDVNANPYFHINGTGYLNQTFNMKTNHVIMIDLNANYNTSDLLWNVINSYNEEYKSFYLADETSNKTPDSWLKNNFTKRKRHVANDWRSLDGAGPNWFFNLSNPTEYKIQLDSNGEFLFDNYFSVSALCAGTSYFVSYSVEICSSDSRLINDNHTRKISSYVIPIQPPVGF